VLRLGPAQPSQTLGTVYHIRSIWTHRGIADEQMARMQAGSIGSHLGRIAREPLREGLTNPGLSWGMIHWTTHATAEMLIASHPRFLLRRKRALRGPRDIETDRGGPGVQGVHRRCCSVYAHLQQRACGHSISRDLARRVRLRTHACMRISGSGSGPAVAAEYVYCANTSRAVVACTALGRATPECDTFPQVVAQPVTWAVARACCGAYVLSMLP
jgi:hypothetical protein